MFDASPYRQPVRQAGVGLHVLSAPAPDVDYHLLQSTLPILWPDLTELGPMIVQVRHRYARLIARIALPALEAGPTAPLHLRPSAWKGACLLRPCACLDCRCPPSIRLHDAAGGEFLQLCAPPDMPRARWRALSRHFATPATPLSPEPDQSGGAHLAVLPRDHGNIHDPDTLASLLAFLAAHDDPVRVTLASPGATLDLVVHPERLFTDGPVLTLGDSSGTLQIALPALHGVTLVTGRDPTPRLHLVGPGLTSLLTLAPVGGRPGTHRWLAFFQRRRA